MARRGDTKPLCQRAQAGMVFIGVSLWPISDSKTLVLCHVKRTTYEGGTQAERTPDGLTLASRLDVAQGHTVPETPVV